MIRIAFLILIFSVGFAAFAQEAATPSNESEITRADLAQTYLRFEQAIQGKELTPERAKELNEGFDQATLAFFQNKFAEALETINAQTLSLQSAEVPEEIRRYWLSLRAVMNPPVYIAGKSKLPMLRVEQMYPVPAPAEAPKFAVAIRLRGSDDVAPQVLHTFETAAAAKDFAQDWSGANRVIQDLTHGKYDVGLLLGESNFIVTGTWSIVPESLDAIAKAARLDGIEVTDPALVEARAAVRSRNALLTDTPSPESSAQLLFDPVKLAAEVAHDIEALAAGRDPFNKRMGDYWRTFEFNEKSSPIRVYAPASINVNDALPLVVAFHGAGIDENGFMDAYGAGILKMLADHHRFLLVTPLTYDFRGNQIGEMFDALVDALSLDYTIDRERISVLGHSMGGGAVSSLVAARPDAIKSAACLCGFGGFNADVKSVPPTLVIAAQYDPLANPARLEPLAKSAKERGLPVEYKLIENYGHTITVGKVLPETIDWLLTRTRE